MGPMRQNPTQRTVRSVYISYVCALHCAQLLHTILRRTDLIISPLPSRQSPLLRWCLFEGMGGWAKSITCYMGGPDLPWEWEIVVDRGTNCKVLALSAVSCAKTAKPIHLPFRLWTRVGRRMHMLNRIRQVAPMCPCGRTRCRHLSNIIEPSMYGGDAPYGKLLWPLVIFGHADLHSRTDSQALRAKYCIVGIPCNTAI